MVLVQAVFCNILSSASDLFQARKPLLVACTVIAFIGAAIVPGSESVGRLIAGQTLIGAAIAVVPLTVVVPSEILPLRWRPSKSLLRDAYSDTKELT
jgi:MFS family permease